MLLQNNSKRLITINAPLELGQRNQSHQIKCGLDNKAEVPDELCDNAFVNGLIEAGDLVALTEPKQAEAHVDDGLDDMNKSGLTTYAEAMGIDVLSKWTIADIINAIRAEQSE
ncbi:MAG: hypothetical protein KAR42_11015 [candidate division Zixibacteria bacterium]|nr:hypothetical protein [candidate division Zixibacteria bacterium]